MTVDRHLKSCKVPSDVNASDNNHPLYSYFSSCTSFDRTRRQHIKTNACKQRYESPTIPYLENVLCDEQVVIAYLVNNLFYKSCF